MARLRAAVLALLCGLPAPATAQAPVEGWCAAGIRKPLLQDDAGSPSVRLYVAQAPLFSRDPKIGNKTAWAHLFHTALVLAQDQGGVPRNWTLEFDSVTDVLGASLPQIDGTTMTWNNDARYCLTEGILWGESHWSKTFKPVAQMTAVQANRLFDEFVLKVNASAHGEKPLYQLWRVVTQEKPPQSLIKDITCGDGTSWVLHYVQNELGLQVDPTFQYNSTAVLVNAASVEPVDVTDATEWDSVVSYFKAMAHVFEKGLTEMERFRAIWAVMPVKYIYDSNSGTYYKLNGNRFPGIYPIYREVGLAPFPWQRPAATPVLV